ILGYQKHAELSLFGNFTDVVDFEAVDHAAIARACGCSGIRVEKPVDFLPALKEALARNDVTVIDVVTDERAHPPITVFEGKDALNY
ncbi:MAG: acetolactate synthase catalytic subunit, partial [Chelatococcus sp.]